MYHCVYLIRQLKEIHSNFIYTLWRIVPSISVSICTPLIVTYVFKTSKPKPRVVWEYEMNQFPSFFSPGYRFFYFTKSSKITSYRHFRTSNSKRTHFSNLRLESIRNRHTHDEFLSLVGILPSSFSLFYKSKKVHLITIDSFFYRNFLELVKKKKICRKLALICRQSGGREGERKRKEKWNHKIGISISVHL